MLFRSPAGSAHQAQAWQYEDGLGRVTRYTLGGSSPWTTSYGDGQATTTRPGGERETVSVDGRGRAVRRQLTSGGQTAAGLTQSVLEYDGFDAVVTQRDSYAAVLGKPDETTVWTYDVAHRLESVTRGGAETRDRKSTRLNSSH